MAKLDLALIVRTVDKATAPLRRIQQSVRQIARNTGLDRVGRQVVAVGRQMRKVGEEAGRFGRRTALGLAAAAGGALFFVQRYANVADTAQKMADRIGIGVEEMQRLSHAFDLGGVAVGQSQRAMLYFTARIGEASKGTGEAADMFDAMGISIKDANGTIKSSGALFNEVADAMHNNESAAQRAYAAQILFGRAGRQMVKVLGEGSEAIRRQGAELDDYRLISEAEGRAAEQYIDEQLRLKQAITGVRNAIAADLVPELINAATKTREWIVENRPEIVKEVKDAIRDLGGALSWTGRNFAALVSWAGSFFKELKKLPIIGDFVTKLQEMAEELGWAKLVVIALTAWVGSALLKAILGLFAPLGRLVIAIAAAFTSAPVVALIGWIGSGLKKALLLLFPVLGRFGVAKGLAFASGAVVSLIGWIGSGLKNAYPSSVSRRIEAIVARAARRDGHQPDPRGYRPDRPPGLSLGGCCGDHQGRAGGSGQVLRNDSTGLDPRPSGHQQRGAGGAGVSGRSGSGHCWPRRTFANGAPGPGPGVERRV